MLLAVALCLSLLSGLVFTGNAATVDYVTGNATGFNNVIKNWGERGTTATYLSQNAEDFYSDNGTSYEALAQLSGSSSTASVASSKLYKTLQNLMKSNHSTITSYADTRGLYRFTDCQNSDDSAISSFYSGKTIGPAWDSGATWNREHTWPNSKGLEGSDEDDIMMLRPTAGSENSARGNKAYGDGSGFYDPNAVSGNTYNLHGDVARIMLYVYVRWGNTGKMWGSNGVIESKDVLLDWIQEDPVDTWELGRNDSVESITGTRNVFVDYPELAFILFDEEIPSNMVTPSGEAYNSDGNFTISAICNNDAYGTVSVSGRTINATPAAGCKISGYTVVSGSAKVTQDGNVFTVSASSDCTVRINFEAKSAAKVSFKENGTTISVVDTYAEEAITLPTHHGAIAEEYSFVGWVTAPVSDTTKAPAKVYAAQSVYCVTESVTFHALYSRVDSEGNGESNVFDPYTGAPTEGDYLIVSDGGAMKASTTKSRFDYTNVTFNNDSVMNPAADIIWHIAPTADGYFTIYNESTGSYAGGTGGKNKGALLNSVTDYAKWSISGGQVFDNVGNRSNGVNSTLRRNATYGFACYAASTGTGMKLYKLSGGAVYYTTKIGEDDCNHLTQFVPAVPADCQQSGTVAYYVCGFCGKYFANSECTVELSDIVDPQKSHDAIGELVDAKYLKEVANCHAAAVYFHSCSMCGEASTETFSYGEADAQNHDGEQEVRNQVNDSCTDGYTGDIYCTGCDVKLVSGEAISGAHKLQFVAEKAASHDADGNIAYYVCSECENLFADEKGEQEITAAETVIVKEEHTFGQFQSDEDGHWKTCQCGAKDEEGTHVYGEWIVTKEAGVGVDGSKERECTDCGYKQIAVISGSENPQTSDNFQIGLLVLLVLTACGFVAVTIVNTAKKHKR